MWLCDLLFSSVPQIWYVEVRMSRSVSESPLGSEIKRVDYKNVANKPRPSCGTGSSTRLQISKQHHCWFQWVPIQEDMPIISLYHTAVSMPTSVPSTHQYSSLEQLPAELIIAPSLDRCLQDKDKDSSSPDQSNMFFSCFNPHCGPSIWHVYITYACDCSWGTQCIIGRRISAEVNCI